MKRPPPSDVASPQTYDHLFIYGCDILAGHAPNRGGAILTFFWVFRFPFFMPQKSQKMPFRAGRGADELESAAGINVGSIRELDFAEPWKFRFVANEFSHSFADHFAFRIGQCCDEADRKDAVFNGVV